jgi:cysteinyl-tRNA synthetase
LVSIAIPIDAVGVSRYTCFSMIYLTNTLTRKKEAFVSLEPKRVKFYVCGVTVYDFCHLGHARAYVSFDMIRRYLSHLGYDVQFVQNFTDIDDKIITRAGESGVSCTELTEKFIEEYHADMDALGVQRATIYTYATGYVQKMIDMIGGLIDSGHAYVAGGDVCFSVDRYSDYGKLSKKVLDDLISGIRVEVGSQKKNPLDFVLWKAAKVGEPSWESPWGPGRPGWHIECSAMAIDALGQTIDIHAGGEDLVFPHHENEIAQSESYTGKMFAKYWLHNGFVTINHEKMSKSLHNFIRIRDILENYDGEVLRFYLLRVQYRNPLHFSEDGLKDSAHGLSRFYDALLKHDGDDSKATSPELDTLKNKFFSAMNDDFNSAQAIGVLFEILKYVNSFGKGAFLLKELGGILGLFETVKTPEKDDFMTDEIRALVDERQVARANKNFAESDRIRDVLKNQYGVLLEDGPEGQKIRLL